jgi:PAS domain S-box-containing protein
MQSLLANPDRLRLLIERLGDVLCLHAADGTWDWVSPSSATVLGYSPSELVGRHPSEFWHPDDGGYDDVRSDLLESSRAVVAYRFRNQDGTWRWVEVVVTGGDGHDGHEQKPGGMLVSVIRDTDHAIQQVLRARAAKRLSREQELAEAITAGQLELHYQPVVRLSDESLHGYEGLVRWRHPKRGLLLPHQFLDIAEEGDLIQPLGEFVIDAACRFLSNLPGETVVAVNVSARQLGGEHLVDFVGRTVERHGVDPSRLSMEITETALLDSGALTLLELQELSDMGVGLAMDDFGTGYSVLAHLRDLPISVIKMDRSFTAGLPGDQQAERISLAVANLTRIMGIQGIAEGVETEAQARRLREHGWDLAQGFLYGRAVHPSAMELSVLS